MKLRARNTISAAEEVAIRESIAETDRLPADHTFIRPGEELSHSRLLIDGLMCRYKDLSNGQRQIIEIHVAGDFADLHSFTLKYLDHSLMTLTPCTRMGSVARPPHRAPALGPFCSASFISGWESSASATRRAMICR
jgi:CRP-like cAMP-binding protein